MLHAVIKDILKDNNVLFSFNIFNVITFWYSCLEKVAHKSLLVKLRYHVYSALEVPQILHISTAYASLDDVEVY